MSATQTVGFRSRSFRRMRDSLWFTLALAGVVPWLLAVPTGLLDLPATVDAITFENRTVYDINIAVSSPDDDSWMLVATVSRMSSATVVNVIDQGAVWRIRFRGQGRSAGELTVSRQDLAANGWQLVIPAEVGERLAAAGAPPSPP